MYREKINGKALAVFPILVAVFLGLAIIFSYFLLTTYMPPKTFSVAEMFKTDGLELRIDSVKFSDRVVGFYEGSPGSIMSGNQTAFPEEGYKFAILGFTLKNKENVIVPALSTKNMFLHSSLKNIYDGSSIEEVFEERIRTYSTKEDAKEFYCERVPKFLSPESSVKSCVIFHIREDESLSHFFYTKDEEIIFVVNLE